MPIGPIITHEESYFHNRHAPDCKPQVFRKSYKRACLLMVCEESESGSWFVTEVLFLRSGEEENKCLQGLPLNKEMLYFWSGMAIPDKWIELLKHKTDEEWGMLEIVSALCNR